jgi:8-oxo-dGTP diphosphatase
MGLPDAVVAVVTRAGQVLMIRRGLGGPDAGYWAPPSGKIEPGERQADAVVREVREEVGLTVTPIGKIWENVSASGTHRLHWWLADAHAPDLILDGRAASDGRWVSVDEIAKLAPTYAGDRWFFERIFGPADPANPPLLECVAGLLIDDGRLLVEVRRPTKSLAPGAVAIAGGHVEGTESFEDAIRREIHEELGVVAREVRYVCTLLHRSQELRRIHYFAVTRWEGTIENHEAASLRWLPLDELESLDFDVDRIAVAELARSNDHHTLAEAGHDVQIFLLGEAVSVMRDPVAAAVVPVGWPPLAETLRATVTLGIPIHV